MSKKCPKCGSKTFQATVLVAQNWIVDENGNLVSLLNDLLEVTHFPDDEDIWECNKCHYSDAGKNFNIEAKGEYNNE